MRAKTSPVLDLPVILVAYRHFNLLLGILAASV
jgi:hypothetical protein